MATINLTIKRKGRKNAYVQIKDSLFYDDNDLNKLQCLMAVNYSVATDEVLVKATNNFPFNK
ncbi:hypothetical protein QQ054_31940 [Oscillatoria amoena NRMC-F 0135]|nr:hypothetical protein [Oscillatoria amoena NRMC-F 0135]